MILVFNRSPSATLAHIQRMRQTQKNEADSKACRVRVWMILQHVFTSLVLRRALARSVADHRYENNQIAIINGLSKSHFYHVQSER